MCITLISKCTLKRSQIKEGQSTTRFIPSEGFVCSMLNTLQFFYCTIKSSTHLIFLLWRGSPGSHLVECTTLSCCSLRHLHAYILTSRTLFFVITKTKRTIIKSTLNSIVVKSVKGHFLIGTIVVRDAGYIWNQIWIGRLILRILHFSSCTQWLAQL